MAPPFPEIDLVIAMLDLFSLAMTISGPLVEHFGSYCKPLHLAHRALKPSAIDALNLPVF